MAGLVDVDLDALAPVPLRVKLAGKTYKLPGDMPLELFLKIQGFEQRVERGEDENALLSELHGEVLALFQVNQPQMTKLPAIGVLGLLSALGHIYSGGRLGEDRPQPNRAARRSPQKKRTPSSTKAKSRRAI